MKLNIVNPGAEDISTVFGISDERADILQTALDNLWGVLEEEHKKGVDGFDLSTQYAKLADACETLEEVILIVTTFENRLTRL